MRVVQVSDREAIAAFGRRNAWLHAYELGDLDDFFWPHTTWWALERDDEIAQLALLYHEHELPVLLALAEPPTDELGHLLTEIRPELPGRVYAHLTPAAVDAMRPRFGFETLEPHLKMGLLDPKLLEGHRAPVVRLGPEHVDEVEAFYAEAYPGTWFQPRMLESGRYVAIRHDGSLVCVAGVHVHSPTWGVAALGNVATLPQARGHGLARGACAELCRLLLEDGIDAIGLNVHAENAPAIAVYRRLGFQPVAEYVEVLLTQA
jgi:ribosomal protein S18 acetylase RimI-like enzyme